MRVLLVLTVFAGLLITVAFTGQTEPQVLPVTTNKSLLKRYDLAVRRVAYIDQKINCKGTKAYLNTKRKATWKWQDASYTARTRTSYADRRTKCSPYLKWQAKLWAGRAHKAFKFYTSLQDQAKAICHVFGSYCSQALTVARCESGPHLSIRASNGQYLGLFQMGDFARGKYGHSHTAIGQAYSAHQYFVDSGKDWSPWSCKPH